MKKISIILGASALLVAAGIFACNTSPSPSANKEGMPDKPAPISQDSLINRGRYLVGIMGCNDCHTPTVMTPQGPQPDSAHLFSGHPAALKLPPVDPSKVPGYVLFSLAGTSMVGPWGTSYSANISSDATGIGNWSEAQFFKAMREGKYKGMDGGRELLPPMPWPAYAKASDEDLRAIFAYLKSTPPVENIVPAPLPPAH